MASAFEYVHPLRAHFQAIGRKGGLVKSAKKAKAARKNGKLGGRPRELEMEYPATLSGRR